MFSVMDDKILWKFEWEYTFKGLWDAFLSRFDVYMTAQLRSLNIKFDSYKMNPQISVRRCLRHMGNLIMKLKDGS